MIFAICAAHFAANGLPGGGNLHRRRGTGSAPPMILDEFDHDILRVVQECNLLSHADVGERVGLSASSVRRRLQRLRKGGVIEADVSIVNPDKTRITVIVTVVFERESLEGDREFKRRMVEAPEVSQCYSVAGGIDFVLVVHAASHSDYEAWGERMLMADPRIRRYDSHIAWSRVKFTTAIQ